MAVLTGMRRGEILNLKWADVNFKYGFILVRGRYLIIPVGSRRDVAEYIFPKIAAVLAIQKPV